MTPSVGSNKRPVNLVDSKLRDSGSEVAGIAALQGIRDEGTMSTVIRFPDEKRAVWHGLSASVPSGGASIIILPVVRVERSGEPTGDLAPENGASGGGRRRRPGRRS
jgi:hypothetical protein